MGTSSLFWLILVSDTANVQIQSFIAKVTQFTAGFTQQQ